MTNSSSNRKVEYIKKFVETLKFWGLSFIVYFVRSKFWTKRMTTDIQCHKFFHLVVENRCCLIMINKERVIIKIKVYISKFSGKYIKQIKSCLISESWVVMGLFSFHHWMGKVFLSKMTVLLGLKWLFCLNFYSIWC